MTNNPFNLNIIESDKCPEDEIWFFEMPRPENIRIKSTEIVGEHLNLTLETEYPKILGKICNLEFKKG